MNTKKRKLLSAALLVGLWMPMTSLAQSVNAVYKSTPIEKVFSDLREKTKYEFVYQKQILQGVKPITCSLKDLELRNALNTLLKGTGLEYEIVDQTVIIRKKKQNPTNTKKINGTVISKEDGLPIIGASIRIIGSDFGTITDLDGKFEFKDFTFSPNTQIQVSYIGMKTVTLNASSNMHIVLENDA